MDPVSFLRRHPPFDRLGPEQLRSVEDHLDVVYQPKGATILRRGGSPSEHLYIVRKGVLRLEREGRLVQEVEEGECFGFPSLIGRSHPHADVIASDDVLLYRIPGDVFRALMETPRFAEFFLLDLSARLRHAASLESVDLERDLAVPARQLLRRDPVTVHAESSVGEAARTMRDAGVSSVIVQGRAIGIVTDRDLRSRVLAAGRGPETLVHEVMTSPVRTLPADATLFEALVFMLEHNVHHVPLEAEGRVIGVITNTDLLRVQVKSPLHLIGAATRGDAVGAQYGDEMTRMVDTLASGGLEAPKIGRVVARLNDALVQGLLRAAERDLGPPPAPYAWIVFGSEGRMEQALLTDQDNALAYADDAPEMPRYAAALAERVVGGLVAAGVPPCPGGYMATHHARSLGTWERSFRGWIETPEPQALLEAAIFFDFRVVHGALDTSPIERVLASAPEHEVFLAQLARAALGFTPPIGAFRQLKDADGMIDLKRGGIQPIVGLARVYALASGSAARGTLDRLAAAQDAGALSAEGAATLGEAFRFLLRLRLREQLRAWRAGGAPDNRVTLAALSPLETRHLKETFLAIRELQDGASLHFAVDRLG